MKLEEISIYVWMGYDELGDGTIGLKQGFVPAGRIAIVATKREKIDTPAIRAQLEAQAQQWGKKIRLVRFTFAEVLSETPSGRWEP